jgi:hypothetical protein
MWRCRMVDTLFKLMPLKVWQDFLIRYHISNCPGCQGKLANKTEIRAILISESEIPASKDLWPGLVTSLNKGLGQDSLSPQRNWRWGYAAVGMAVIVAAVIWNLRTPVPIMPEFSGGFQIKSIEVDGRPAQAFLFKSEDPNVFYVWAEKGSKGE